MLFDWFDGAKARLIVIDVSVSSITFMSTFGDTHAFSSRLSLDATTSKQTSLQQVLYHTIVHIASPSYQPSGLFNS